MRRSSYIPNNLNSHRGSVHLLQNPFFFLVFLRIFIQIIFRALLLLLQFIQVLTYVVLVLTLVHLASEVFQLLKKVRRSKEWENSLLYSKKKSKWTNWNKSNTYCVTLIHMKYYIRANKLYLRCFKTFSLLKQPDFHVNFWAKL